MVTPPSGVSVGHHEVPESVRAVEERAELLGGPEGGGRREMVGVLLVEPALQVIGEVDERRDGQARQALNLLPAGAAVVYEDGVAERVEDRGRELPVETAVDPVRLAVCAEAVWRGPPYGEPDDGRAPPLALGDIGGEGAVAVPAPFVAATGQASRHEEGVVVAGALPGSVGQRLHAVDRRGTRVRVEVEEVRESAGIGRAVGEIAARLERVVEGVAADLEPVAAGADVATDGRDDGIRRTLLRCGDPLAIGVQDRQAVADLQRVEESGPS